jgi:pimeloyl-ACP methyl ester carboxylesterase
MARHGRHLHPPRSVGGVRSSVREIGPIAARDREHAGASEAVVFVHGNPGSSEDWVDLMTRVGTFARAVAPDMPGFGKAERPRSFEYTVDGFARHLGGLIDRLGVDRAHLVLHDFGGPWGLAWAAEHLDRVASLTLIDVGVMPGYRWHKFARVWRTPVVGELTQLVTTRGAFRLALSADNPRPLPRAFLDRMYDDMDWGMRRAILALYRATDDLGELSRRVTHRPDFRKVPTLVVWGTGDAYLPVRYAEEQRRYFDVVEVDLFERCGHWPFIDEPDRVGDAITSFLRPRVKPLASQ